MQEPFRATFIIYSDCILIVLSFLYLNLQPLLYMHITGCILLYEDLN